MILFLTITLAIVMILGTLLLTALFAIGSMWKKAELDDQPWPSEGSDPISSAAQSRPNLKSESASIAVTRNTITLGNV